MKNWEVGSDVSKGSAKTIHSVANKVANKVAKRWSIVGLLWLAVAAGDRLWFALDHGIPAWDQADYLTGSLNYWHILQHPEWFSGHWWTQLWLLSSKIPPFTYLATVPFLNGMGRGPDQAALVMVFFSAVLFASVYCLGVRWFSPRVGLWAIGLCALMPGLYQLRLQFLLDYPVAAMVTLCFYCLTQWRDIPYSADSTGPSWGWAIALGGTLGLALLTKQTILLFLTIPLAWVSLENLWNCLRAPTWPQKWGRITQLLIVGLGAWIICGPWYRTNWFLMLTASKRATLDSALLENSPPVFSVTSWLYYWHTLPQLVSWPLLLVPIVGWGLGKFWLLLTHWTTDTPLLGQQGTTNRTTDRITDRITDRTTDQITKTLGRESQGKERCVGRPPWLWIAVFLGGAYVLNTLNPNKDVRYLLPCLPILALVLAYGLTQWSRRWGAPIRWGTVTLAFVLWGFNLFPSITPLNTLLTPLTQRLTPHGQYPIQTQEQWPHTAVIQAIATTDPYLRATLGVLPSTLTLNQHNLNYYGALANFQVYGRQVGVDPQHVQQDGRSLNWFLTKTGDQGSLPTPDKQQAQAALVNAIEKGGSFQPRQTWTLPDDSTLTLYHRIHPPISVQPLPQEPSFSPSLSPSLSDNLSPPSPVQLQQITLPKTLFAGSPVPVTYQWIGSWQALEQGIVLLTYRKVSSLPPPQNNATAVQSDSSPSLLPPEQWFHDHGIAFGNLQPTSTAVPDLNPPGTYQVTEHTAMLPPPDLAAGTYTLEAQYLNRLTGKTTPLSLAPVTLTLSPSLPPTAHSLPAPELDLVTQLQTLSQALPQGFTALDALFQEIGRINQYDPTQDYTQQAALAWGDRLKTDPDNLSLLYGLTLAQILQRNATGAIATLRHITTLTPNSPYPYAYLGFVHLYNGEPGQAHIALQHARTLAPESPEIQTLSTIATWLGGPILSHW